MVWQEMEVMRDESVQLAARVQQEGGRVRLEEWPRMWFPTSISSVSQTSVATSCALVPHNVEGGERRVREAQEHVRVGRCDCVFEIR